MLAELRIKEKALRDLRTKLQDERKPWNKELQEELNLIHNLLKLVQQHSKMRSQRDDAVKVAEEAKAERQKWLEHLGKLTVEFRELAQEVRFAAFAKSLPKKEQHEPRHD
jgi:hypothetical protein